VIQHRHGGSGIDANVAQGFDSVTSEDGCLAISVDAFDGTDERRHGSPRRRTDPSECSRRTNAHVLVWTFQDFEEGGHGWTSDPNQTAFHRVIDEERAHAGAMLTPSLEESIDEDRNCQLCGRPDLDQGPDGFILELPVANCLIQIRHGRPGLRAQTAERPRGLTTVRFSARLVPKDLPPSLDRLAAERALFDGRSRLEPRDHGKKGRKDGLHAKKA
jgi:hypothetical protein